MLLILNLADNPAGSTIIDIADTETVDLLKQMIEARLGMPYQEIQLFVNDNILPDGNLVEVGLQTGTAILVKRVRTIRSVYDIPNDISPPDMLALVNGNPQLLEQIRSNDRELASVLDRQDVAELRLFMMKRYLDRHKIGYKRERELAAIEADPMNEENQRKIEDAIRQANVQQNMELAVENLPESFGVVQMLYVNIFINDHPICAFVDSGAQSTIMSEKCAQRCGLMRLVDTRFAGTAQGVGTARILGKIHIAQMKFGSVYFPISITVLESNGIDFLFGLDTLKRYKCCIDLTSNTLRIGLQTERDGTRPDLVELPFLSEGEVEAAKAGASAADELASNNLPAVAATESGEAGKTSGASEAGGGESSTTLSDAVDISMLLSLGFSERECRVAIEQAGGNLDLAASLLMENRL